MLQAKNNFRGQQANLTCRACKTEDETQDHILYKCQAIHKTPILMVNPEDLFSQDTKLLKITAKKLNKILEALEKPNDVQLSPANMAIERPGDPDTHT